MKKSMIFAAVAAFMLVSFSASAQFVQSTGGFNSPSSASVEDVFNTFDFTYSPVSFHSNDDSEDLNGVSLNWAQARVLTPQLPVYLQYGAGLQYSWKSESKNDTSGLIHFLTAKVPVNVLYNFAIPNTSVSIMPYVGLNAQLHILGQNKYSYEDYYGDMTTVTLNFFDEDDMDDEEFNRVCLGWQIGAMLSFNKCFIGVGYNGPVTNLYKDGDFKINFSQVNISLGIKF